MSEGPDNTTPGRRPPPAADATERDRERAEVHRKGEAKLRERPRIVDPAIPVNAPCHLAVECAVSIANYCLTRFPTAEPPHPMLDVPWFAEKVQRCIDEATTIGLNLKSSLEAADAELFRVEADRDRLKAALEMLAQCRHVSGSAQGAFRCNLRITDAVLAGADVRDVDTVEAIVNGEWKPTENQS